MINENRVNEHNHIHIKCISWTAILAGGLVGVGLSFLLNLFSIAIGLTAYTTSPEGSSTLAIGGFIGLLIGGIVAMYMTGWVAGHLSRPHCHNRNLGALYGFLAWTFALILGVLLASQMGKFVSYRTNTLSNPSAVVVMAPAETAPVAVATPTTETGMNLLGSAAFLTFVIFGLGAVASCFGGHCAVSCRKEEECR